MDAPKSKKEFSVYRRNDLCIDVLLGLNNISNTLIFLPKEIKLKIIELLWNIFSFQFSDFLSSNMVLSESKRVLTHTSESSMFNLY